MAERDAFADRKRAQEEDYFRKQEKELIDRMKLQAALETGRAELARATGVSDETTLKALQALGYTADALPLVYLAPAVQVAWAEGSVTPQERSRLLEAAAARGVAPGTPASAKLEGWLTERPHEAFFDGTLGALRALLEALPADRQAAKRQEIVADCRAVAEASGGLFGLGRKISAGEQKTIDRIASLLA